MTESPRRILVADDDESQRSLVATGVRRLGYEVIEAGDGNEALNALLRQDAPRMAILDWNMPGLSGPELCKHVRQAQKDRYTYLILLSVRDDIGDVRLGLEAGADDYLAKSSHPVELRARIDAGWRLVDNSDRLATAVEQLTEANTMLSAFSRTLAHDLRGMLTTICGYAYLLQQRTDAMPPEGVEHARDIEAACARMQALVDDVLVLETAARTPQRSTFDPHEIIADASADTPNVRVVVDHLPRELVAHRSSLARSFKNLFENASRYAKRSDVDEVTVHVDTNEDDTTWTFTVEDDGPGIPPQDRQRVLETFTRGSNATDSNGTGLGLSIVAACARAHDGSVVISESEHGGARVDLTLRKP